MISELAALLFFVRDYAHRAHLRFPNYGTHKALEALYEELTDSVDTLVESYQGRFDLITIGYYKPDVDPDPLQPVAEVTKFYHMVHAMRYIAIPKEETMLQNQLDEIERVFASALYKLRNLT